MEKTRVDVEPLVKALQERAAFNRLDLANVEFFRDGKPVEVPPESLDEFLFSGLSNIDFVRTYFMEGT